LRELVLVSEVGDDVLHRFIVVSRPCHWSFLPVSWIAGILVGSIISNATSTPNSVKQREQNRAGHGERTFAMCEKTARNNDSSGQAPTTQPFVEDRNMQHEMIRSVIDRRDQNQRKLSLMGKNKQQFKRTTTNESIPSRRRKGERGVEASVSELSEP
jgi:hypothetical protein